MPGANWDELQRQMFESVVEEHQENERERYGIPEDNTIQRLQEILATPEGERLREANEEQRRENNLGDRITRMLQDEWLPHRMWENDINPLVDQSILRREVQQERERDLLAEVQRQEMRLQELEIRQRMMEANIAEETLNVQTAEMRAEIDRDIIEHLRQRAIETQDETWTATEPEEDSKPMTDEQAYHHRLGIEE